MLADRKQAAVLAKSHLPDYLLELGVDVNAVKSSKLTVCPICGGGRKTGCFHLRSNARWKCFSCGRGGDIFDLYAALHGEDFVNGNTMKQVYEKYHLLEEQSTIFTHPPRNACNIKQCPSEKTAQVEAANETDLSDFLASSRQNLPLAIDYLAARGISLETAKTFGLGFVQKWRHPKAPLSVPTSPRLIIPTSRFSYLARDTRPSDTIPDQQIRYAKSKVGATRIFNIQALDDLTRPCIIVEGELDAISIVQSGGNALALGSVSNQRKLCAEIKKKQANATTLPKLILALDNDPPGQKAASELLNQFTSMGISATIAETKRLFNGLKDANEALVASSELFSQRLKDLYQMNAETTSKFSLTNHVANFRAWLSRPHTTVPSCFPSLDRALNGMDGLGLPIGLYVVGGESSAGKTTFLHAIMDSIAKSGHDVMIISLEMSTNELISKSISRESFLKARREYSNNPWEHAYSYKQILNLPDAIQNGILTNSDQDAILKTLDEYHEACNGHMIIRPNEIEGLSAMKVRNLVKDYVENTHKTPVILIDYLQILKAANPSASDKSNVDQSIQTCAEISKEFQTPVFVISALNRLSYSPQASNKPPVKGLSAFKESGLIEYAADIALMIEDISPQGSTTDKTIKINVLKNRNGPKGGSLKFTFVPEFNFFLENKS